MGIRSDVPTPARCLAARDHVGICPLYIGWGADGSVWFASEFKALQETCTRFEPFPPGHVYEQYVLPEKSNDPQISHPHSVLLHRAARRRK